MLVSNAPDRSDLLRSLDAAWAVAVGRLPRTGPLVVLFSGGVDSGLLAWELRGRDEVTLSTFALPGASDAVASRSAAALLGLPLHESRATPPDVRSMRDQVEGWVGPLTPTEAAIETALALAVRSAPPGTLVCGQGADELFLGYAHFRGLAREAALARAEADLDRLRGVAWPRTQRVARELHRTILAPYLEPEFVAAARAVPASDRVASDPPKAFFRRWAGHRGLPAEIALRPKKALQYGSGVDRLLKKGVSTP